MSAPWRGTCTALVTPMQADGAVDHEALQRLVDMQIAGGVEGLLPCGTTGEAATLTNEEHLSVIDSVIAFADGRSAILAGIGGNDTRNVITLGTQSADAGADGVLAVAPYYNKPTQAGMLAHFTAVADAVALPLVLYNVPGRTSSNIEPDTVLQLAEHPNIVGIKEASGSLGQAMAILRHRPEGFRVLSGEDDLTLAMICMGADGVVSVVSNEVPQLMGDMVRHALAGRFDEARSLHYRLLSLMQVNFIETNPTPAKAALAMMGLIEENYRLPLVPLAAQSRDVLAGVLRDLSLLSSP
jgi:4-hydroxy-tetrahydrodipicolinate synthase